MGYRIVHICDNCSYEAMITGGKDFGFFIITETLECAGCQTLADYEVAPTPGYDEARFGPIQDPRCDQCDQTNLKPWSLEDQGHCPRCYYPMRAAPDLGSINGD